MHAAEHLSERRAEYESFAWEFVRTHLVNPNVSSDYVDQSSFLTGEGERAAWIGAVKRSCASFSSDACAEVSTGHVQVFQMHVRR